MIDTRSESAQRGSYLVERAVREERREIRRLVLFGLLLGWIMLLVGGFGWHAIRAIPDPMWIGLAALGALFLVAAVVLPQVLMWPERAWMALANVLGSIVMAIVLSVVYVLWFWPVGAFQRWRRGSHPFHAWEGRLSANIPGWEPLHLDEGEPAFGAERRSRRWLLGQFFDVIGFFAKRGHWAMVPILILLLAIGVVLFFVSNTALAPFIYTLF